VCGRANTNKEEINNHSTRNKQQTKNLKGSIMSHLARHERQEGKEIFALFIFRRNASFIHFCLLFSVAEWKYF
jgi:hypothetical protein